MSDATISFPMLGENFSINPSRYFTLFGKNIYWYGIIIAVGFILAAIYIIRRSRQFGLTEDNVIDMFLVAVPSGVVGARLYYVVFNFSLYKNNFWDVFKIWEGGLAIYGAIIFGFIGILVYCKIKKISFGAMLDIASFGVIIGQTFGRWGNFLNREAYGAETDIFCKMGLTNALDVTTYVHPTFLYESIWNLIGFAILHYYSKKHRKYDGQIFLMYLVWYGLGRFFIEGLRADSLYLFGTDLRVSQLVAVISLGIGVFLLLNNKLHKQHKPEDLFVNKVKALEEKAADKDENGLEEVEDEFDDNVPETDDSAEKSPDPENIKTDDGAE